MKKLLAILLVNCVAIPAAFATHNRAGEITFVCDSTNILKYFITITTYTKESSIQADRCDLEIRFGDGDIDTIPRINGPLLDCPTPATMGETVPNANDVKMNIYTVEHTFPCPR